MTRGSSKVRGYGGFYKNVYLRSSLEFAYAYYLDSLNKVWEYEKEIYDLENYSYKPDFFIYEDNKLVEIVEIKGEGNFILGEEKVRCLQDKIGVKIVLLTYKDILKLYQEKMPIRYHKAKDIWINEYGASLQNNYNTGKMNPMYGVKQKEATRAIIGEKARIRFQDPEYKKRFKESICKRMADPEERKKLSLAAKARYNTASRTIICKTCGKEYEFLDYVALKNRKFCSLECAGKYNIKKATEGYEKNNRERKNNVINYMYSWVLDNKDIVNSTPLNKIKTNLEPMLKEIEREYGVKDFRVLSRYIFKEDRGRKELLQHLKEYISENVC